MGTGERPLPPHADCRVSPARVRLPRPFVELSASVWHCLEPRDTATPNPLSTVPSSAEAPRDLTGANSEDRPSHAALPHCWRLWRPSSNGASIQSQAVPHRTGDIHCSCTLAQPVPPIYRRTKLGAKPAGNLTFAVSVTERPVLPVLHVVASNPPFLLAPVSMPMHNPYGRRLSTESQFR